jgi:histone H3/H4
MICCNIKEKDGDGDVACLSRKRSFQRFARYLIRLAWVELRNKPQEAGPRVTALALEVLQEAAEGFLVSFFEELQMFAIHAKRVPYHPYIFLNIHPSYFLLSLLSYMAVLAYRDESVRVMCCR